MRNLITLSLAAGLLAACATPSDQVMPSYVSGVQYEHLRCDQIAREAQSVSTRAAQLAGQQDERRTSDAIMTGVAVVVFWPALFAIGGDNATTAELARLKGEMEALRQASNAKDCGIVFEEARPAEPPPRSQSCPPPHMRLYPRDNRCG